MNPDHITAMVLKNTGRNTVNTMLAVIGRNCAESVKESPEAILAMIELKERGAGV